MMRTSKAALDESISTGECDKFAERKGETLLKGQCDENNEKFFLDSFGPVDI